MPDTGFPRTMYFNRCRVDREDKGAPTLLHFGFVNSSGVLVDYFACVLMEEMLNRNSTSLLEYYDRMKGIEADETQWSGTSTADAPAIVDVVSMAYRGRTAEIILSTFSLCGVLRKEQVEQTAGKAQIDAQPVVLLRSRPEMQKRLIKDMYGR